MLLWGRRHVGRRLRTFIPLPPRCYRVYWRPANSTFHVSFGGKLWFAVPWRGRGCGAGRIWQLRLIILSTRHSRVFRSTSYALVLVHVASDRRHRRPPARSFPSGRPTSSCVRRVLGAASWVALCGRVAIRQDPGRVFFGLPARSRWTTLLARGERPVILGVGLYEVARLVSLSWISSLSAPDSRGATRSGWTAMILARQACDATVTLFNFYPYGPRDDGRPAWLGRLTVL